MAKCFLKIKNPQHISNGRIVDLTRFDTIELIGNKVFGWQGDDELILYVSDDKQELLELMNIIVDDLCINKHLFNCREAARTLKSESKATT